jgi:hypothetical protein
MSTMFYAEQELAPLGFQLADIVDGRVHTTSIIMSNTRLQLKFDCVCPAFPHVSAMGCPLHHKGAGTSSLVTDAKRAALAL